MAVSMVVGVLNATGIGRDTIVSQQRCMHRVLVRLV
jgi:hypothetical protein